MRGWLTAAGLLAASLLLYPSLALTNPGGSPGSRTGAPVTPFSNELTCATSDCHGDAELNAGPGTLIIDAPEEIDGGDAVEITIRVEEPGRSVFGFQVAVKAFDADAGFFDHVGGLDLVDATATRFVTGNYITQTDAGRLQNEWTVRWHAPLDASLDSVMIYVAANAANGDDEETGDHIYTASHVMYGDTGVAAEAPALPLVFTLERAYPNPAQDASTIAYTLHEPAAVTITVYDALGRRVQVQDLGGQAAGRHRHRLATGGLAAGLYVYELRTATASESRPLLVLR